MDDVDGELEAMAAGLPGGARQYASADEGLAAYVSRATSEAEFAVHKFFVSMVHPQTDGLVRYADLLRAVVTELNKIDPDERAEAYRIS